MNRVEYSNLFDCHVHLDDIGFVFEGGARRFSQRIGDLRMKNVGIEKHLKHIRDDSLTKEMVIFEKPESLISLRNAAGNCEIGGMYFIRDIFHFDELYVKDMMRKGLVQGLKIHPVIDDFEFTSSNLRRVLTLGKEYKLPILFHSDDRVGSWHLTSPDNQEKVVSENPDNTFIIGHGGAYANPRLINQNIQSILYWDGPLSRRNLIIQALELTLKKDNVWYDLSICTNKIKARIIADFVNLYPSVSEKILVGTDFPINSSRAQSQLMALAAAGIKDTYLNQIAGNRL